MTRKVIFALSQDIGHRLLLHNLATRTVQVHVRGNDLFGSQYQCKLPLKTQLPSEIAVAAFRSFAEPPVKLLKELYDISERSCAKWRIEMRYPMLMVIIW